MFHQINYTKFSINKFNQIIFVLIILIGSIFNGSNSILLIKLNFLVCITFLIFLLFKKNNLKYFKYKIKKNKYLLSFFLLFILFLTLQIIPIPNKILKIISIHSYEFYSAISLSEYNRISLNINLSISEILNYLNIFLIIVLTDLLFFKKKHINRYLLYFSIIGFFHAFFGVLIFLLGNPDFFLEKVVYYKDSASGFFVNRTNFALFLILTFLISINYILANNSKQILSSTNFKKNYVRIFIIFITIGIICSFSRLGNFYLVMIILYLIFYSFIKSKKKINSLTLFFLIIFLFDILIIGIFFGGDKLLDRFNFFNESLPKISSNFVNENLDSSTQNQLSRYSLIILGIEYFKNFIFFGYGAGSFETVFLFFYKELNGFYANHSHADIIELIGELGIIGFLIVLLIFYKIFQNCLISISSQSNSSMILLIPLIFIFIINGFFDFSLNIPSNQYLFASLMTFSIKKYL